VEALREKYRGERLGLLETARSERATVCFRCEGQVARSLREAAAGSSNIEIGFGSRRTSISGAPNWSRRQLPNLATIVINPAAYTAVDKAEPSPTSPLHQLRGAGIIRRATNQLGIPDHSFVDGLCLRRPEK